MEQPHIVSSEFLEPATKLENAPRFKLTGFDDLMAGIPYHQRILFYSSTGDPTSFEDFVQLLKRSLAEVLVVFYPFAGRILSKENVVDCGVGQSIKFSEAVTSSTLAELGDFSPSEFCNSLCHLGDDPPKYPWTADHPLLLIQVTRFGCGGVSLGFAFNHNLVDGTSAWHFMTSWSELARTGSVKLSPDITYDYNLPELTDEEALRVGEELGLSPDQELDVQVPTKEVTKLVTRTYRLDKEMIEKLKSRATAETDGRKFSTFVVISAFLWRQITIARQLPGSSKCRFGTMVNCRGRNPSLSKAYFGNAVSGTAVTLEAGEIERNGFWHCAAHLQESINTLGADKADRAVACYNWLKNNSKHAYVGLTVNNVQATGSPRHPVYETDFGFGRPVGATLGTGELSDGKVILFPCANGDGGVAATVALDWEVGERLSGAMQGVRHKMF